MHLIYLAHGLDVLAHGLDELTHGLDVRALETWSGILFLYCGGAAGAVRNFNANL